jgi:hypothetical protein
MSKESAAAILVQTLFTADASMQHLVMSHAKVGSAKPEDVVQFILPYYTAMLKAMDGEGGQGDSESENGDENSDGGTKENAAKKTAV